MVLWRTFATGGISRTILSPRALTFLMLMISIVLPAETVATSTVSQTEGPAFRITLMVPQNNPARQAWSLVIQNNLQSLGIDAGRVITDFSSIFSRVLTPDSNVLGKTYDEAGFDVLFIGYALGIDADPWPLYHSSQFPPVGQNYYLWSSAQNDQLTAQIEETVNKTARLSLVKQWQVLAQDESPSIPILYTKEIVAFDSTVSNAKEVFSAYHYPTWPPVEHLSMAGSSDTVILAQTGPSPGEGLNPLLTTSYYDTTVIGEIFNGLAQRNDTIFKNMVPALADGTGPSPGWSVASDQKTWTVHLRQGVKWHDGVDFNATDVKFTFDALQDDTLASPVESFVKGIVGGKDNVTVVDPYTVRFSLPVPYAYFVENLLGTSIIPKHFLGSVPYTDWASNPFNTGVGGGPVGTGPYKWVDFNPLSSTVHLTRNDNYFDFPYNGKTALTDRGGFEVKEYYVREIVGSDAAITALKNGEVNVLDSQYHLETQTGFLSGWGTDKWVTYDAFGVQEMGVNMKHPILGTGVDTPLGRRDPSKAALAAKYVRQAISHAIPRELIIEQLLAGYGNPGITTPVVGDYRTGFAVTEGFNTALKPHDFNMTRSRELLQLAGYFAPTNRPPALAPMTTKTVGQGIILTFQAEATDPDNDLLAFSLETSPPSGASISSTGLFTWTPSDAQQPGSYLVTIIVTDDGSPQLSTSATVLIIVLDTVAPVWLVPSALVVSDVGTTSLRLTWTPAKDNVAVTSYRIYQDGNLVATLPQTTLTYTVTGLTPGTSFTFQVESSDYAQNLKLGPKAPAVTLQSSPSPNQPGVQWQQQYTYLIVLGMAVAVGAVLLARKLKKTEPQSLH